MNRVLEEKKSPYHALGMALRNMRDSRGLTQEEVAKLLKYARVESYSNFERGKVAPHLDVLLALRDVLKPTPELWKHLQNVALPSPDTTESKNLVHTCLILDPSKDQVSGSECLGDFYKNVYPYKLRRHKIKSLRESRQWKAKLLTWQNTLFQFNTDKTSIVTGVSAPDRIFDSNMRVRRPNPSYHDQQAIDIIRPLISDLDIKIEPARYKSNDIRSYQEKDLILTGGPGSNELSRIMNNKFQEENWYGGFHFFQNSDSMDSRGEASAEESNTQRSNSWSIRHKVWPDVDIHFTRFGITDQSGERYQQLEDGWMQDYGVVYIGPNPMNLRNWLVMVAGLGRVGSLAAARVLERPHIMEFLSRWLFGSNCYCSVAIRYHFQNEDAEEDGCLSGLFLTAGQVPVNQAH